MAVANLYINKIEIGGQVYNIGMDNAVHYHGSVTLPGEGQTFVEFYSDAACSEALKRDEYSDAAYIYSKGASLSSPAITELMVGCMVTIGQKEFVLTSIAGSGASQINTWNQMGEVQSRQGSIVTAVSHETGSYVTGLGEVGKLAVATGVSTKDASVVASVGKTSKDVKVIGGEIGSIELVPSEQSVVSSFSTGTKSFLTDVHFQSNGDAQIVSTVAAVTSLGDGKLLDKTQADRIQVVTSIDHTDVQSDSEQVLKSFTGGVVSKADTSINIPVEGDKASALTSSVITGVDGVSVVTGLDHEYVDSVDSAEMVAVQDHTLKFNFQSVVTGASKTNVSAAASKFALGDNIGLEQSSDTFMKGLAASESNITVVTSVGQSAFAPTYATVINSVTGGSATYGTALAVPEIKSIALDAKKADVATEIEYTAPVLTSANGSIDYVASASKHNVNMLVSDEASITVITAVPVETQSVITAIDDSNKVTVITGVSIEAKDKAEVISAISLNSADAVASISTASGSVVTAAF